MNELNLFSGGGIGILAAHAAGIQTVAMCEKDEWCCYALKQLWPEAHLFTDVHDVTAEAIQRHGIMPIYLVTGGFPCTDISTAGKGAGICGKQSGLWFQMLRIIEELRPAWVLIENVPALRSRGANVVIAGLEKAGYTVLPPVVVGAWAIGASHKRDRVWIVAHCPRQQRKQRTERDGIRECSRGGLENTAEARRTHAGTAERNRRNESNCNGNGQNCGYGFSGIGDKEKGTGTNELGRVRLPSESAGELADAIGGDCGGGSNQPKRKTKRRVIAGRTSQTVAIAASQRREEPQQSRERKNKQEAYSATPAYWIDSCRWPSRPGQIQYYWEAPRLIEFKVGNAVDGLSRELLAKAYGIDPGSTDETFNKVAGRIAQIAASRSNKAGLQIAGNSWVPQIPYLIFKWIVAADKFLENQLYE